jgi:hypothetical protein
MTAETTSAERYMGKLTQDELDLLKVIAGLLQARRVPYGRGVFLFGRVTGGLIKKAVDGGADPVEVPLVYLDHFMAGAGIEVQAVGAAGKELH